MKHSHNVKHRHSPIIGITTYPRDERGRFHLPAEYVQAVRAAGGVPVLLPPGEAHVEALVQRVDGVILAGGGDLDPALYGGQAHPRVSRVDPERDAFEIALAKRLLNDRLPVLGICRGSQVLNVASGGDLVEHLPDEYGERVRHVAEEGEATEHEVTLEPDSRLAQMLGATRVQVVSKHHQAVRHLAPGWRAVAYAPDGVLEAAEHQRHPWMLAVLWHPEMGLKDARQQRLFAAFVQAAAKGRAPADRQGEA